jgi:ATP-dependent Lon protease
VNDIIVALIALLGTVLGSMGGVIASSRLTAYRLKQLEEKVDKHNNMIERTYVLEEQMKQAKYRLENLEDKKRVD